jgi:nucleoside-diphosphate-sugar epimerase
MTKPPTIASEADLEELLSRPTTGAVAAMRELDGDLLILGAGGKMGPSLARLARRAADEAGRRDLRVIAVSRFSSAAVRDELERAGVEVIACDLLEESARRDLPQAPNVLFMLGHKFGGSDGPERYWAMNVYLPGLLAEQFQKSRIVCFSSGNVYPFTPLSEPPPKEDAAVSPIGEYALTVLGRERMLQYASVRHGTPVCLLRLNYAVEPRYGVLVDIAGKIVSRQPIDLAVPEVNVIWQAHANAVALQSLTLAKSPAEVLNLTGLERHKVRDLALRLGHHLRIEPTFTGAEGTSALLSDASRCHELFGPPELDTEAIIALTAAWLAAGGRTLEKPTKFHVRDGKF